MERPDLAQLVVVNETFRLIQGLATAAFANPRTNLYNKAALKLLADEHDRGTLPRFAVCFTDLTGFKAINTKHGYDGGDATLTKFGGLLNDLARTVQGYAYHLSGDEFLVLFPPEHFDTFIERACALHQFTVPFQTVEVPARANFGVAMPTADSVIDLLQKRAEKACALAKALNEAKPRVWQNDLPEGAVVDDRWRCACGATVSLLVEEKYRTEKPLICVNCHEPLT